MESLGNKFWGGGKIFHTLPDHPGANSDFYTIRTQSFIVVNWIQSGVDHPFSSSAEVKDRVKLYIYSASGALYPL
jgi:hypothetical protein